MSGKNKDLKKNNHLETSQPSVIKCIDFALPLYALYKQ